MNIDKQKFIFMYEVNAFKTLTDSQHKGLSDLLTFIEADPEINNEGWAAYMLATAKHETADTFLPIAEYGKGKGRKYGEPDVETGFVYYGRGFVQLTWAGNYKTMGKVLGVDLYHDPDLAMVPEIAYKIMSYGMMHGSFTGVSLKKYIHDGAYDYVNARRIINGTDCADKIAGYALKIAGVLRECIA
jgi:predicted chitinase